MVLFSLIKRNIKLFFKDKGLVISSLITPMILILLYVTFLRNVYVDSFHSSLPSGLTLDESYINGFVYGWLFSSLLATSCVTVSFCSTKVQLPLLPLAILIILIKILPSGSYRLVYSPFPLILRISFPYVQVRTLP